MLRWMTIEIMNNLNHREQAAYVYRSTLKSRYLIDETWIARLGPRDKQVPNPHYLSGPPASLYRVARVETFLDAHAKEFLQYLGRRAKRSNAMTAVAETKRQELREWARSVEIEHYPWPENLWQVCQAHLEALYRCGLMSGVPDASPRHILNMLRHAYTNYETLLADTDGKVGASEAYSVIKQRVNREIGARLFACGISVSDKTHCVAA